MRPASEQAGHATPHPGGSGLACCWASGSGLGVLLGAAMIACSTGCQTQGARPPGVRNLQLTDIGGYAEFVTRQRENDQKSKVGAGNKRSKESIFEENVKLEVDGYTYHPNLLEFTLGGLFGLLQEDFEDVFDDRVRTSGDDGTVLEFDLNGRFFKKKKYPGTVHARRYRVLEPRPFQSSLETTTTDYGVLWQYIDEKTPTSFQFTHTDIELDPLSRDEATGRQQNTNLRFDTAYNFTDHNTLSLSYNHQSVKEEPFDFEYDSDEVTLTHNLNFGEHHQHSLESELNYFDQRGTFDIERARWREILRLQHSDTLRSWYRFEAINRIQGSLSGVPPIEERSYSLIGTVEHKLYESLVSQLMGFVQTQDFALGPKIDRYGVQPSFDYRKKNPWGALLANYRVRLDREDRTGGDRSVEVFRERHTFKDPEPITLSTLNIVTSSIWITAEDGFTTYQRGRDYEVEEFEDRVEIRRVPTGRIAEGEVVLVNYVFEVLGSFTLDTISQNFGIRQDFDFGLSPYYRLRWQDQSISPETALGARPEDITSNIVGVEFERWKLRLRAEYEDYNSTINPFDAIRLSAGYRHRFKSRATASVKARWTDVTRHLPVNRETTFFTLEGRYRHPITDHLTVETAGRYRKGTDSVSTDDEGFDLDFSLEWIIRQTEVRVTYEFQQFEDDFARNDSSFLYVQVRRNF